MFCIINTFDIVCVAFSVTALPKHLSSKRPYLTAHWTYEGLLNLYANFKLLHNRKITISISSYLWKNAICCPEAKGTLRQQSTRSHCVVPKLSATLPQDCLKVFSKWSQGYLKQNWVKVVRPTIVSKLPQRCRKTVSKVFQRWPVGVLVSQSCLTVALKLPQVLSKSCLYSAQVVPSCVHFGLPCGHEMSRHEICPKLNTTGVSG